MILIPRITGGIGNQLYYVLMGIDFCVRHELKIRIPRYLIDQSRDSRRSLSYISTIFSKFEIDESGKTHEEYIRDPNAIVCRFEELINSDESLFKNESKYIYLFNTADEVRPSRQLFNGRALTHARKLFQAPKPVLNYLRIASKDKQLKVITIQIRLGDALYQQDNFYIHYDAYYRYVLKNFFSEKDKYSLVLISDSPNIVRRLTFWNDFSNVFLLDEDDVSCWFFGIVSDHVISGNSTFGLTMALCCQTQNCLTFTPMRFRPDGRGIYRYKQAIRYITPNDGLDFSDDEPSHPPINYVDVDDGPTSYFSYTETIHPPISHQLISLSV